MRILAFTLMLAACTPPVPHPVPPGQVDGSVLCAHLADIGCPQPPNCAPVYDKSQGVLLDVNPTCLMQATDVDAARACKTVGCPQ